MLSQQNEQIAWYSSPGVYLTL